MTARRRLAAPFVLVCTLATLAACTGSGPSPTPSTPPATSPTGAPPPPSPAVTGHPAGIRCVSAQLTVSVGPGPNAAGHVGLLVVFTNTGAAPCTMSGYPGVSFMTGPSGTQIGDPAERVGTPRGPVILAPQGRSHANLLLNQVGNYSADGCKPVQAAAGRGYPPAATTPPSAAPPRRPAGPGGPGGPSPPARPLPRPRAWAGSAASDLPRPAGRPVPTPRRRSAGPPSGPPRGRVRPRRPRHPDRGTHRTPGWP